MEGHATLKESAQITQVKDSSKGSTFKVPLREEPFDIDAERALLSAMMLSRDAVSQAIEILGSPDVFYLEPHRIICQAIFNLFDRNEPCDLVSVQNELKSIGKLEQVGGLSYLTEIFDIYASPINADYYAKIIRDKATLRELIRAAQKIVDTCYESPNNVDEVLDEAERLIFEIKERRVKLGFTKLSEIIVPMIEQIMERRKIQDIITGIPTGFDNIDKRTMGLHPGNFVIVAARPSIGKSAFVLNIAEYVATKKNIPVGVFSLEMSREEVFMRMLCSIARVNSQRVRGGFVNEQEMDKISRALDMIKEAPIFVDDTTNIPLLELRAKARRLCAKEDVKLIIIDYLQLITGPRAESRQQEVTAISKSLKGLARELNIPIIAVSQLSREPEKRTSRKPQLADLRESGALEQDADIVMLLYRKGFYAEKRGELEGDTIAEVKIAKNRNGPTSGWLKLAFVKDYARFDELSPEEYPEEELESEEEY